MYIANIFVVIAFLASLGIGLTSLIKNTSATTTILQTRESVKTTAQALVVRAVSVDADDNPNTVGYLSTTTPQERATGVTFDKADFPSGIQAVDGYGRALRYCAWNNGLSNSEGPFTTGAGVSVFYLPGSSSDTAISYAVISAGKDGIFQTTCTAIASSSNFAALGDDVADARSNFTVKQAGGFTGSNTGTNYAPSASPPIGAVVPWMKSLTGVPQALPPGWMEANGATVNDAASPLNGRALPNLNGNNQFLRGNATSGTTGGAATHTHTTTLSSATTGTNPSALLLSRVPSTGTAFVAIRAGTATTAPATHTQTSNATSSLPPYYDVVYIIRVK